MAVPYSARSQKHQLNYICIMFITFYVPFCPEWGPKVSILYSDILVRKLVLSCPANMELHCVNVNCPTYGRRSQSQGHMNSINIYSL